MKLINRNRAQTRTQSRKERGVGMIEVMVAMFVFAIGMLSLAALQATALRNSQSSLERSQAAIHTYAILDAMRANIDSARIGNYNLNIMTCRPPNAGNLQQTDLHNWITAMQQDLGPTACGQIECGSLECLIRIRWDDSRSSRGAGDQTTTGTGAGAEHTMETRTRL